MKPTGYFHFYWNPCLRDTQKELRMIWPYRSSQLAIYWDYWEQIQLALREWCKLMIRANWLHEKRWHPISYNIILGDPGAVSQVGRKDRTKIFKYRQKSPWVMTLIELFPKIQADAVSWLCTKNALYYCAQSANSFSWVLSVTLYTTAIVLPHLPGSFIKLERARETFLFYFPVQKRRNYRWVEKMFGMLSAGAIQFAPS